MFFKIILIFISLSFSTFASKKDVEKKKKDPIGFFSELSLNKKKKYKFNPYENIISGTMAFVIGNVGYYLTDSSSLKLTYSGIQTIGVINIGQGIYKINSPSIETSFYKMVKTKRISKYSKKTLAKNIIKIFAKEERAKRLALFYNSSILSVQYLLNATLDEPPGRLKNIYFFLSGINAIVATYAAIYKNDYERYYYGDEWDFSPFAFKNSSSEYYGVKVGFSF